MDFDPDKIAHELSERGLKWADADAAFKALDETTKTVLSECIGDLNEDLAYNKAEVVARRSQKYRDHLIAVGSARREANRSRVHLDVWKTCIELMRSQETTRRAEMQLT